MLKKILFFVSVFGFLVLIVGPKKVVTQSFHDATLNAEGTQLSFMMKNRFRTDRETRFFVRYGGAYYFQLRVTADGGNWTEIKNVNVSLLKSEGQQPITLPLVWDYSLAIAKENTAAAPNSIAASANAGQISFDYQEISIDGQVEVCSLDACRIVPVSIKLDTDLKVEWRSNLWDMFQSA